ncbi:MAG: hypothetical protein KAS32_18885 [Candidatus Peribacteraceae bacterium]|nr:hypothetical protein [Candidatus Peribacteraceae bacterium]
MTLEQIASAIRNNVGNGLKEVGNFTYSIEQIKDEISNVRSQLILEGSKAGSLNHAFFSQRRENLDLAPGLFPEEGFDESNNTVLTVMIPKLAMTKDDSSVLYIGPADMSLNLKVYYDFDHLKSHKYTRVLKNRPHAFIDSAQDSDGDVPVFIFNNSPVPFKVITVRAIFDDPVRILEEDGIFSDDEEFPAPLAIQETIIDRLTIKYINYYKKLNHPNEPNDQTDKS